MTSDYDEHDENSLSFFFYEVTAEKTVNLTKKKLLLTGAFNHISWSTSSDRADSICQWRLWDAVENFLKS